jgi:hypothetical protein
MKHSSYSSLSALALLLGTLTLVGCGGAVTSSDPRTTDTPAPPAPQVVAGPAVNGYTYGGHAPIQGQHVYLLQPGTTGYGSAATSLLGNNGATSANGYTLSSNVDDPNVQAIGGTQPKYVTSDANGAFSFTGAYNCAVGQPVYIYAWGGTPGGTINNNNIVQLATLGNCPSSGNFSTAGNGALQFIYLNEVSTIATAYTFQPFTLVTNNSAWDIGSTNTTQGLLGIANAANTAAQLYNIVGTTQLSSTHDGEGHLANTQTVLAGTPDQGNGIVPQATIDSLANIVADCVDSVPTALGTVTSQCNSLFTVATDNGETGGTQPIDTATAAINIARFPAGNHSDGTANVDATYVHDIFALQGSGTTPYVPQLSNEPNDWTIAINYPESVVGGYTTATNSTLGLAESIAIDDIGQVWVTAQSGFYINRFSNLGARNSLDTLTYIPGYVSIDGQNNAWTGNADCGTGNTACPNGTAIFEGNVNGFATNAYGSGYQSAYTVVANNAGDAFFFALTTATAPNYGMFEYGPTGTLSGPFGISGTTTTPTPTPVTQDLNITKASETNTGGTYTYTFDFTYAGGTPPTPLAVGDTVPLTLANDPGTNPGRVAATGWPGLTSVTVASVNGAGTQFTATGTTPTTNSNDANGAATTAAINITAATETKAGANYTYTFEFTNGGATPGVPLAVGDVLTFTGGLTNDPGSATTSTPATGWGSLTQVTVATVNSATTPTSFTATGTTSITRNAVTTNTVSANLNSPTVPVNISAATVVNNGGGSYTYTFDYTTAAGSLPLAAGDVVYFPTGTLLNDPGTGAHPVPATGWNNLTQVTIAAVNGAGTVFTATGGTPATNTNSGNTNGLAETATVNISAASETHTGGGNYTYTFTYTLTGTNGTTPTPLAAGDILTNFTLANQGGATEWNHLPTTETVATVNAAGTQFTVTGGGTHTTNGTGVGATGSGTYPYHMNGAAGTGDYHMNGATGSGTYPYTNANGATGTGSYVYTGSTNVTSITPGDSLFAGTNVAHGAIDSVGDIWITSEAGDSIGRVSPTGASEFTPITTITRPEFPAIDNSNNAWIPIQATTGPIYVVTPTGTSTQLTSASTGANLSYPFGSAVDGNGNVWVTNRCGAYNNCALGNNQYSSTLIEINGGVITPGTANTAISPSTNYLPEAQYPPTAGTFTPIMLDPLNIAIDPSGNIWITNYTGVAANSSLTEIVGAAAPVVTPLSVAAGTSTLGTKP